MSATTRVAVIGCGYFARYHLAAWRALAGEGVELVAVCDVDPDKAAAAAREYGAGRSYADAAAMLDAGNVDLVDIATRMDTHLPLARLCADRAIAAIVQKPLAPRWEDAIALVEAARAGGSFLAVHENFRFQDAILRVRSILDEGRIGAPSWARIGFRTGLDVYANQPYFLNEDRLVILDLGIHLLDLARVLLGEVDRLSCETQRRNPRVRAEDTATMLLRHRSGAVSVVECTYESRRPPARAEVFLEIEGPKGAILLDRALGLSVTEGGETWCADLSPPDFDRTDPAAHIARTSVLNTCRHILTAYRAGLDAEVSGDDNLKTFALVEAAYRAAASGRAEAPFDWRGG